MKKIFTLDQLLTAFISAAGWGIGALIPESLGEIPPKSCTM